MSHRRHWPRGEGVTVETALAALENSPVEALRRQWQRVFQRPPPRALRREALLRVLAFELQAAHLGGLSARIERQLLAGPSAEPSTPTRTLKPGTHLVREWQGQSHPVKVLEAGFEYSGKTFESLSAIACTITGTHWSGPRFFGIGRPHGTSQ